MLNLIPYDYIFSVKVENGEKDMNNEQMKNMVNMGKLTQKLWDLHNAINTERIGPPFLQFLEILVNEGQKFTRETIKIKNIESGPDCTLNVLEYLRTHKGYFHKKYYWYYGFALYDKVLWTQHSWLVDEKKKILIETRIDKDKKNKRTIYYGIQLPKWFVESEVENYSKKDR